MWKLLLLLVLIIVVIYYELSRWEKERKRVLKRRVEQRPVSLPPCSSPPVTGNLQIVTSDTQGDSNCSIRLGTNEVALIGQPFSATWNDANVPDGGYVLTWGDTSLFYGSVDQRLFGQNFAAITHADFVADGNGFGLSRGGIVPCDCCGTSGMQTPFKVTPIRRWIEITPLQSELNILNHSVVVSFEPNEGAELYVVSVKIKRVSTLNGVSESPNIAHHGLITGETTAIVKLSAYEWSDELNSGLYDTSFDLKIYGFRACDMGGPALARAGNFAIFT